MSDESDTQKEEDKMIEDFYRVLDEVFGAFDSNNPEEKPSPESWVAKANRWFISEFNKFNEDVEEIMEYLPGVVGDDPNAVFGSTSDCTMDVWIDGRHYEVTVSRLEDSDEDIPAFGILPEPTLKIPAEGDEAVFTDEFQNEWV